VAQSEYDEVWFQTDLPRAAPDARRSTLHGTLRIENGQARFLAGDQVILLEPLLSVMKGKRGSDFINRWIEVRYGDSAVPSVAYLNDGGWRGWRPLLKGTNRQMAADLSQLTP
jgi:hypothetical protein